MADNGRTWEKRWQVSKQLYQQYVPSKSKTTHARSHGGGTASKSQRRDETHLSRRFVNYYLKHLSRCESHPQLERASVKAEKVSEYRSRKQTKGSNAGTEVWANEERRSAPKESKPRLPPIYFHLSCYMRAMRHRTLLQPPNARVQMIPNPGI